MELQLVQISKKRLADNQVKIFTQNLQYPIKKHYWIRLLKDTDYLSEEESNYLLKDVEELLRIIGSIQKKNNS